MSNSRGRALGFMMFFVVTWILFALRMPKDGSSSAYNYSVLLIAYLVFSTIAVWVAARGTYLFEPITLVLFLYYLVFLVRPLLDIYDGTMTSSSGRDMSAGCAGGTVLFLVGFIALLIGYYNQHNKRTRFSEGRFSDSLGKTQSVVAYNAALVIWLVSFCFCMVYFLGSGYGFFYVLSMGSQGSADLSESSSLMIFSTFKSCLITSWLYIALFGESRVLKAVTFLLGLSLYVSMGGRALTLAYLMTPVVYLYCSKRKTPAFSTIVLASFAIVMLCVVMEASRSGIRSGSGFAIPALSIDLILSPFDHELTTYKAFYAVVDGMPSRHPFLFGQEIFLYTIVMMIPRALWPGKPSPPIYDIIGSCMDNAAVSGGAVYPNIGEFYVEFGIVGVIVFMYVFGRVLRYVNKMRLDASPKSHALILYSALLCILLQVTIRGYTPSNFYQVLLLVAPVLIVELVSRDAERAR